MLQFNNTLVFDLASYGCALALINKYADDINIKVFEVSPCGTSAILILLSKEALTLNVIKTEAETIFKAQILNSEIIENINQEVLSVYLSQNKPNLETVMGIFEGSSISTAFKLANEILLKKINLIDFRIIRTFPKNVILTVSTKNQQSILDINKFDFKLTVIDRIEAPLKEYFEIN